MKTKLATLVILSAVMSSPTVLAAESPDWNYAEVSIERIDFENGPGLDPVGLGIKGSYLLTESVFVSGDYSRASDDVFGEDVDVTRMNLNIGYRYGINDTVDVYGALGYRSFDLDADDFGGKDDGPTYTIGSRARLTDKIEVEGFITHERIDEGSTTFLGLGANYYITDKFAVGLAISDNNSIDQYSLTARYSF